MSDQEIQAGICGENWWSIIDSTRSVFPVSSSSSSSSPCSMAANDVGNYSTWKNDSANGCGSNGVLVDSTLQMLSFGLSSSTSANWSHSQVPLSNFHSMLQEEMGIDSSNSQVQKDWTPKSILSSIGSQLSTIDNFKSMNQEFSSYGFPSTLIQSLYERDPQPQSQQSLFTNHSMFYSSAINNCDKVSSFLNPLSMEKQQQVGLHFSNNAPFWNASVEALNDIRAGTLPSSQYQKPTFEEKLNCPTTLLNQLKSEEFLDLASLGNKNVCEPEFKRLRIETPSPLPTFKVPKEKLGDRVTALQQLVSPYGKTDTASVLHEAIEYIKLLHDQVSVFSTPYMKSGDPIQHQQDCDEVKGSEGPKQDLRSRGLCLVPISSTFPVATETTADFWAPTLGGSLIR